MRILEITLQTGDLGKLSEFYGGLLGMDTSIGKSKLRIKSGHSVLSFEKVENDSNPFYHFAFNIPENQLDNAIDWLNGKVELISLKGETVFDFKAWEAHSIYFYDPAGNIIEFIARHRLNNSSTKPFTGKSILSISEMGMPVKKVKPFFEQLYKELKLQLFTGDLKTFTAGGDDKGLLIIVPEERKWFPDCPRAEIYPIHITISGTVKGEVWFEEYNYRIKSMSEQID
jgi:extradiol dioxygenase family protein